MFELTFFKNKITVEKGYVAILTENGAYRQVLPEGIHFIPKAFEAKSYALNQQLHCGIPLFILLKDPVIAEMLEVVEVKEGELVLWYEQGVFKQVLIPDHYVFWKEAGIHHFVPVNLNQGSPNDLLQRSVLTRPEVVRYLRVFLVESFERGLLFIDRKFERELPPGQYFFWINNTHIQVLKADMRVVQLDVTGQEILTKDKATLRVNFQIRYAVRDIQQALLENREFEKQLYTAVQLALRARLSTLSLDELLDNKSVLAEPILESLRETAADMGLELIDCGIKDLVLPGEMREIMNRVLLAQKTAEANVITRREETASTRSLLNTAKLLEENEMLFKLKEMEYVEKIAEKIHTISLSGGGQIVDQLKQIFTK